MKLEVLSALKRRGEKIAVITGYDAEDANLLDGCGIDVILVGDSVGNVRLGYPDTTHVRMEDMSAAAKAVRSAGPGAPVVVDMPIHSYGTAADAVKNARQLIAAGGDAVKLEGGLRASAAVKAITEAGMPVMGHIGHTPQTDRKHVIRGRNDEEAQELIEDAEALEEAGAFSIVIELLDSGVAGRVTDAVAAPTIGIGAGPHVSGQVLVLDDLLGWTDFSKFPNGRPPRFLGDFWDRSSPENTVKEYIRRVKDRTYPGKNESYDVFGR